MTSANSWLWQNGAFTPADTLPISDRGFRYGMTLFESLRVRTGHAQFLPEHLARLRQAGFHRRFPIPGDALDAVAALLAAHGGSGFARIYITAGDGPLAAPVTECRCLVTIEPRPEEQRREIALIVSPEIHHPPFGGLKTANYWPNVAALEHARAAGADDALLFNERAELISTTCANIFIQRDGELCTPALNCGARSGVTRQWILNRHTVRECSLFLPDLAAAEEIFITNSWSGILPVARLDARPLATQTTAHTLRTEWLLL